MADKVPIHNFRNWTHTEAGLQVGGTDSGVPPGDELDRAVDMGLCKRRDPGDTDNPDDSPESGDDVDADTTTVDVPDDLPDDYHELQSLAADVKHATGQPYPESRDDASLREYVKKYGG